MVHLGFGINIERTVADKQDADTGLVLHVCHVEILVDLFSVRFLYQSITLSIYV